MRRGVMNNLNSVLIEGNVVGDPELSYSEKGTAQCHFRVACHRSYKEEEKLVEEVGLLDIASHGRLAETCAEYLKKGRGVRIVGRLKQETECIDVGDGPDREISRVWIEAEHVEFKPQPYGKEKKE
jgi:single-strand DNA-binding protein